MPSSSSLRAALLLCSAIALKLPPCGALIFSVPANMQAKPITKSLTRFMSLDELFPEAKNDLCDAWDNDQALRAAVKTAARIDFYEDDPRFDEKRQASLRAIARDEKSSLMGRWRRESTDFPALTEAFADNGFPMITGDAFVGRLGGLCTSSGGEHTFGSWMDIVGRPKGSAHAWHQDSGLVQDTVMLGFPAENNYEGEGVFSHVVELSHRMPEPDNTGVPGPVIIEGRFPEEYIVKPVYKKGCEVLIYRDCDVVHSAPDVVNRVGLWRFM